MNGRKLTITRKTPGRPGKGEPELTHFFNLSQDLFCIFDFNGLFVRANPAFEKILGYSSRELIGKRGITIIHPEDREPSVSQFAKAVSTAAPTFYYKNRCLCKDGSFRWIEWTSVPVALEGLIFSVGRDVTESMAAKERLMQSEDRFRTSVENMLDCFGIYSAVRDQSGKIADFRIEYVNAAACEANRLSREEQVGKLLCALLPGHRQSGLFDEYCLVVETGEPLIKESLLYEDIYNRESLARAFDIRAVRLGDGFAAAWRDITRPKKTEEALQQSEEKFRLMAENAWDAIYHVRLLPELKVEYVSPAVETISGYSPEEFYADPYLFFKIAHPEDHKILENSLSAHYDFSKPVAIRWLHKDGCVIWAEHRNVAVLDKNGRLAAIHGIARDITERKKIDEALHQVVQGVSASTGVEFFQSLVFHMARSLDVDYAFVGELAGGEPRRVSTVAAYALGGITESFEYDLSGSPCERVVGKGTCYFPQKVRELFPDNRLLAGLEVESYLGTPLFDSGQRPVGLIAVMHRKPIKNTQVAESIFKIFAVRAAAELERKNSEEKLRFLSLHDSLTGLYNRAYFEQQLKAADGELNTPTGIIICDVDGLKLINDTMGHDAGDSILAAASRVIGESFRKDDIVARIGGDEFAVILPQSGRAAVESACRRIKESTERYNSLNPQIPLSISTGFAVKSSSAMQITDIFKEADNNMYRQKLHRSNSARSTIVKALMNAMEARDFTTGKHSGRLNDMVVHLAGYVGLSDRKVNDLGLLARFHDIGKVGIPDRILFKPGPLTPEEMAEMQRHSEIGYRIANSVPELLPIADWILKHHERWDGRGYPLGLKGEGIPLECRIMAVADAYDAMTSDRPYRNAMTHREAVEEIEKNSGKQFDPQLVYIFLQMLANTWTISTLPD